MTEDIEKFESRQTEGAIVVQDNGPSAIVMMAMQKGYDPALIEKMMDLADRNDKNEARKAYHVAMAAFKANPPEIDKDKTVSYTGTQYSHASLSNVTKKINESLSQQGLSAAWHTEQNGKIIVTCTITHILGHSESTSLSADADKSGSKNAIQAIGSTITYLCRYTLLALTGLATSDVIDDDGAGASEFITDEQRIELEKIMVEKGVDGEAFFKYMKVETTDTIPASDFNKAMNALKKAKGSK